MVLCRGYDGKFLFGILPVATFCSGHTFFVQRMPEKLGLDPYVAHATYQYSGTPGKRHRFREALLWNVRLTLSCLLPPLKHMAVAHGSVWQHASGAVTCRTRQSTSRGGTSHTSRTYPASCCGRRRHRTGTTHR